MKRMEIIILIVVVVLALLIYLLPMIAGICMERKDRKTRGESDPEKARYDERQRLIRLEAGTHALYATGAYLAVWLLLEAVDFLTPWPDRNLLLLGCGLLLPLAVWNGECILRGAYLGFNQIKNEKSQITTYLLLGVCWTLAGITNLNVSNKLLALMQLLLGVNYLIEGILMLYARRRRKLAEGGPGAEDGEA